MNEMRSSSRGIVRRVRFGPMIAALGALVLASPTTAATTDFAADVHDNLACPAGLDLCGKGNVHGFGIVTTTLVFTGIGPGPGDCLTATAERVVTLANDPGSTLVLELVGTICAQKLGGTF